MYANGLTMSTYRVILGLGAGGAILLVRLLVVVRLAVPILVGLLKLELQYRVVGLDSGRGWCVTTLCWRPRPDNGIAPRWSRWKETSTEIDTRAGMKRGGIH